MAFKPFQFLDDNISDPGDLVSFEAFGALANNVNYLMDSMPVGRIIPILAGWPGCPTPDPTIWQECDGSEITHENSPIKGQLTPNYADEGRYMRAYTVPGTIGNYGGGNDKDLSHSHSGVTGFYPPFLTPTASDDNNAAAIVAHRHPVSSALSVINFEPQHFIVKHYIKIR